MQESGYFRPTVLETMNRFLRSESLLLHCCCQISYDLRPVYTTDADQRWHLTEYSTSLLRSSKTWQMQIQHVQSVKTSTDQCQHTLTGVTRWSNKTQRMCLLVQCEVGLCDVDQKTYHDFLHFFLFRFESWFWHKQTCFTVINAFCVNLKHISKGNKLELSQKVVTCL